MTTGADGGAGSPHVLGGFPAFGALQGLTVIDTGTVVAAPFACELAAEAGAQVIRVSLPGPDILELSPYRLEDGDESVSTWWAQENRNKLDMVLDLTRPESKEVLGALLARADIWIESSRPGTYAERLGLTDEWALGSQSPARRGPRLRLRAGRRSGDVPSGPRTTSSGRRSAGP